MHEPAPSQPGTPADPAPEETAPPADLGLPCPQCGYDLRTLPGPCCPECGQPFEPEQLREDYRRYGRGTPSVEWVIRTMRRHPVAFWSMPQVHLGKPPGEATGILVMRIVGWSMASTAAMGLVMSVFDIRLLASALFAPLVTFFVGLPVVGLAVMVHTWLCKLVLPWRYRGHPRYGAEGVVGYSCVWARYYVPAALLFCAVAVIGSSLPPVPLLLVLLGLIGAVVLGVSVAWGVAIHHGALRLTGGSEIRAWWCVICNPFWWPVVFVTALAASEWLGL